MIFFIRLCYNIFAGWIIDIHYLIYHDVTPLLPQLLPQFIEDELEPQITDTIISGYQGVYQSFENDRSAWIPELVLDLANSLSYLPDEYWAREQLNYSVRYWLQLRGISMTKTSDKSLDLDYLLEYVSFYLTSQDKEYFEMLQKCLTKVGDIEEIRNRARKTTTTNRRDTIKIILWNGLQEIAGFTQSRTLERSKRGNRKGYVSGYEAGKRRLLTFWRYSQISL